ncbi:TIM-barrel domain-containing protein [Fimbriimonas ginsengisoli]|uniref:Alpha-glucosidase n=1 Tax=Fimbriimonas ginsengisoli Gsoil 348 TaxID=661478 RepID=A0A068NPC5_FIMGI|nr:TIM-barrel domain-containing protein [Fimbriimonas ginsengisoli]AIE84565.1 alpha-glucosidase [Fimbriimonas ginsengisoli Gsoil 348]
MFIHLPPTQAPFSRVDDGIVIRLKGGRLRLQVNSPEIVRVRFTQGEDRGPASLAVIARPTKTAFSVVQKGGEISLKTSAMQVVVEKRTGAVRFLDEKGKPILSERPNKSLTPSKVAGIPTLRSRLGFDLAPGEAIYGLGQRQDGLLNHRGSLVHLQQENRIIAVPMLLSSRGYGLLWDNPAITDVDVAGGTEAPLDSSWLRDENGTPGGLTGRYFEGKSFEKLVLTRKDPKIDFDWGKTPPPGLPHDDYSVRWTGFLEVPKDGEYNLVPGGDDGFRLFVDDRMVTEDWNARAFLSIPTKVRLRAGRHKLRFEYFQARYDARVRLALHTPATDPSVTWTSEAADAVDYVFFKGPSLEKVIQGYRRMTGQAPMFGRWAFGLWQSRERYKTQAELLDVVRRYRDAKIPLDGIIQDWQYWPKNSWGTHHFDPDRYPDPAGMMRTLHEEGIHTLISVWPKFDVGSGNAKELERAGALFPKVIPYVYPEGRGQWYDPFSSVGRRTYWGQISRELAGKGWDGWWLDGSEAELGGAWGEFRDFKTARGPGSSVFNAYPLMHTQGVYEGWRAEHRDRRAIILTRSAYAGQQRNGAISWSGDIAATWDVFAKQIPAGLNFSMSGIPYWNTDTGGFFNVPPVTDKGYQDLFARWFQFSVFCPMLRIHGTDNPKEIWRWPSPTRDTLVRFDELRYHLLPYIYSTAWQVTSRGSTMMRGLPIDFREDEKVLDITDQFMFGPSLMACPVTKPNAVSRAVYLPKGTSWIDFWTGARYAGGKTVECDAKEKLPVLVRAGSILPYGPSVQNAQQSQDPTELRVYPGANGAFTIYDDAGDGYGYEKGAYATIDLRWDDRTHTLTIGKRNGSYPGMPPSRTFRIVLVQPGAGVGIPSTAQVRRTARYIGDRIVVRL